MVWHLTMAGELTASRHGSSILIALLVGVSVYLWPQPAFAYRPFNLTDAAVAGPWEMELECGPFGYLVDADGRFLVAPSAILNFGLAEGWELVIEGRQFFLLQSDASRRYTVRDTALSVKHIVRQGSLLERRGPSVGLEVGLLLPGVGIDSGIGASFAGLLSHCWTGVAVHVNGSFEITHDHRMAGVAGGIIEGPSRWTVRPVAEFVLEHDEVQTVSGLVGAIWRLRDNLSLDAGWRVARTDRDNQREFRAGFTWGVPLRSGGNARSGPRFAAPRRAVT
jgi:hypothetical protein